MEYKHVKLVKHPLQNKWMVVNITFPFIPPYIGSKKQCERAMKHAEESAEKKLQEQIEQNGH